MKRSSIQNDQRLETQRLLGLNLLFPVVALLGLALVQFAGAPVSAAVPLVFQTDQGYISGMTVDRDNEIQAFLGVPYAEPPIGDRRFQPPGPPPKFEFVPYEAIGFGPTCLQPAYPPNSFYPSPKGEQSEDCLYLNIWSGAESKDSSQPVMVWIHGGALTRGSGSNPVYDGTALARKGVVVVTVNYRLGALGYLAHEALSAESPDQISGNYGVLDQIAALEWVQKNIAMFGGDPSNVTIFGESAGSWSVNALVATPRAKGLFQRAIGQSGGLFGGMARLKDAPESSEAGQVSAESAGAAFAKRLGVDPEADVLAQLRALPAQEIVKVSALPGAFATRPVVDGNVFPEDIYDWFAAGKQTDVPVILGSTSDEGTTLAGSFVPKTRQAFEAQAKARYGELAADFLKTYPAAKDEDVRGAFLDSVRDDWFSWQMRTWARMNQKTSGKTFLYRFSHAPPNDRSEELGAYHAAEIAYVFNNTEKVEGAAMADEDRELADLLSNYWVAFAKTGDPNHSGAFEWPEFETESEQYLELKNGLTVGKDLDKAGNDFFDQFYESQRQVD